MAIQSYVGSTVATILVVDDDPAIRLFISAVLRSNHQVLEAINGKEGLSMYGSHNPELVITDLDMPVMNGLEFVKALRLAGIKVKIISMSASFNKPEKVST